MITSANLLERYRHYQKARLRFICYARLADPLERLTASIPEQARAITKMTVAELIEKRALIVKRTQLPKISASEGIASIWPWNGDC